MDAESMDLHRGKTSPLETNWLRVEDSAGVCNERVARGMVDRNRCSVCKGAQTFAFQACPEFAPGVLFADLEAPFEYLGVTSTDYLPAFRSQRQEAEPDAQRSVCKLGESLEVTSSMELDVRPSKARRNMASALMLPGEGMRRPISMRD